MNSDLLLFWYIVEKYSISDAARVFRIFRNPEILQILSLAWLDIGPPGAGFDTFVVRKNIINAQIKVQTRPCVICDIIYPTPPFLFFLFYFYFFGGTKTWGTMFLWDSTAWNKLYLLW